MRLSDDMSEFVNPDFVPRAHGRSIRTLIAVYVLAIAVIFAITHFKDALGGDFVSSVLVTLIIVSIAIYTIYTKQRNVDLVMSTEFENLLFAAAASLGSNFCIFLKRDGTVIYANDGAQKMFPRLVKDESRALDALLEEAQVKKEDIDRIFSALERGSKERLIFPITDHNYERHDFILFIEPLRRPVGYFVLRGRQYYPERKGTVKMPNMLRFTTIDKVTHLVANLREAVYIIDARGKIEFASPNLDAMLGYEPGELMESKLTLQKVFYQVGNGPIGEFDMRDVNEEVLLQRKNGSLVKVHLTMKLMKDAEDNIIGGTATILESDAG